MKIFTTESTKLKSSIFELKRRRLNWALEFGTRDRIKNKFQEITEIARKADYPFSLHCLDYKERINVGTVQLFSSANKTGVIEKNNIPEKKGTSYELEDGSALVASFNSTGSVLFIIYPYKSERYARNEKNIILYAELSPDEVSDKLIEKCISKYLFYIRYSSVYGVHSKSFIDTFKYYWMLLLDVRNKKKLYQGVGALFIEWSKIVGAGIAGYIVAVITQAPPS